MSWLIVRTAAMNTGCTCLLKLRFSLDLCSGLGLLGPMVLLSLVFNELCPVLLRGFNDFHSHQQGGGSFFLYTLSSFYCRFSMLTVLMCVRWCHIILLIHSSLILTDAEQLFMGSMAISTSSVEKGPFKSCAPIWLDCFFNIKVHKLFVCFGEKFLVGIFVCTY